MLCAALWYKEGMMKHVKRLWKDTQETGMAASLWEKDLVSGDVLETDFLSDALLQPLGC